MIIKLAFAAIFCLGLLVSCASSRKNAQQGGTVVVDDGMTAVATPVASPALSTPVAATNLQKKYAGFMKIKPEELVNTPLYGFIDNWLATPYKWGGTDKRGIDCSAFMQRLLVDVYAIDIPRTSIEQFFTDYIELFGSKDYLSEGDLVFFRTMKGKVVSHVGMYLTNRMFVNSSSSKGVSIASLDDPYWKQRYVAAGRIKTSMLAKYKKH